MLRGDIVWVDLDPARPGEADKRRPAVVVSNDGANRMAVRLGRGMVTVVPLTSNVERVFPFQTFVPAERSTLRRDSKAQVEQIRSVAYSRVGGVLGRVPHEIMAELEDAICLQLGL